MAKKFIIFFFITIANISCNRRNNIKKDTDLLDTINYYSNQFYSSRDSLIRNEIVIKLLEKTKQIENPSIRFTYLDSLNKKYFLLNDNFKLKKNLLLLSNEAQSNKDTTNIINLNLKLGYYYLDNKIFDSSYIYYNKAEILSIKSQKNTEATNARLKKALILYHKEDYLGCETSIFKVIPYYKKINDFKNLNICYSLLGLCKIELKEFDESYYFLDLSLYFAKKTGNKWASVEIAYNNIGLLFLTNSKYKQAINHYEKALNDNLKINNFEIYTFSKQNLAFSKYKSAYKIDFEKETKEIISNYDELNLSAIRPKINLSEYYKSIDNLESAQKYALEAYKTSLKDKAYRDKLLALKQLSEVFPEKYKYYTDEYVKLKDSIADVDKKTSNTFARIEYRVDELNDKNVALEQRNKNLVLYSLLIGLLGLLLYFYSWRQAKKREMILIQANNEANEKTYQMILNEQQYLEEVKFQEQKRISRDIHDAVLGRLFGIRMNLDFLNTKNEQDVVDKRKQYIYELQDVENNLRQISHELNDEKKEIMNNFKLMLEKVVLQQESLKTPEINYKLLTEIPWEKITDEQKINIYRIIQESFQNINKYANAKMINFEIFYDQPFIHFVIKDDGAGFNVKKKSKGIGLKNMRERAAVIEATYTIESTIGNGTQTTIILNLELNKKKQNEST